VWSGADGEETSSRVQDWVSVQEYAAAALVKLSNHNLRFRAQALQKWTIGL
jgi:hypothetical protein